MTKGQNEKDWRLIDEFVNTLNEKGSTDSSKSTSQWFLKLMDEEFTPAEGWNHYGKQTLKTSVAYLKKYELDPLKKDRASKLKDQLFERIQNASEQNEKVTLSLYDLLKASNLSATALHVCSRLRFLNCCCLVCSRMSLPCLQLP